ncbi:MAG: DUF3450 domain-containing protein [Gammaproteobacteria bacterium]|nr:MAG: DUF3450 domain-containing protein [Gammaproteobacteria bacterium]
MRFQSSGSGASRRRRALTGSLLALVLATGAGAAAELKDIIAAEQKKLRLAAESQERIDKLSDERRDLYNQYKAVLKETEGLRIYNKQMSKQIVNQRAEMERIRNTMEQVQVMQRQIVPQMLNMIEGLKQFIALDMPFQLEERQRRIAFLEDLMDDSDVSVAEKFRQVLRAYEAELDFGDTIEVYTQNLDIDGAEREVQVLRVGRVAMVYQTPDGKYAGYWNREAGQWEPVTSGRVRSNIAKGIKIAQKQTAPDLVILPVPAPESAQ